MIQRQLKLRLTKKQEATLIEWLWNLTGVWNWAVRKIELDARDGCYHTEFGFNALIVGCGKRIGIPSHTLREVATTAYSSWIRCFKKISGKPRLKGQRNKLNWIPFPDPIKPPQGNRIRLPLIGSIRFHGQRLQEGKIKCGRIVKRASGWYLCLFIDSEPKPIPVTGHGTVGIDPGFKDLLTLSTGEKIEHPRELEAAAFRLAQAQRGRRKKLAARISERIANRRKDRNHKLSRRLVSENELIVFSKDNHQAISKRFGKSVSSSGHSQLRQMLAYKSRAGGRRYVEVDSKNSTRTCSACGSPSGPTGLAGLSIRTWECVACGAQHDRDINAAVNTLAFAVGTTVEGALAR